MSGEMPLKVSNHLSIPLSEIQFQAIRAQGAGGQNVNKVSSAVHLRFDIDASSLPDTCKASLRQLSDQRINSEGVIVIKAQRFRSLDKNRADALDRLRRAGAGRHRHAQATQAHEANAQQPAEARGQQNQTRPSQIAARPRHTRVRAHPLAPGAPGHVRMSKAESNKAIVRQFFDALNAVTSRLSSIPMRRMVRCAPWEIR
jgi:ribosome-associated protein